MSEQQFLETYETNKYPAFAVTSDIALFTIRDGKFSVLLVQRGGHPYKGSWALPGGFVGIAEDARDAAVRELGEETGISAENFYLEQMGTYSTPQRDPRMRVVSVAYFALVPDLPDPVGGDDAADARFFPLEDLDLGEHSAEEGIHLAFDHQLIINDAVERVRNKLEYTNLATRFLGEKFTLADLRRVYEALWGESLHPSNFRRKVLSTPGFVEPTDLTGMSQSGGRNAMLYKTGDAKVLHPAILRSATEYVQD